MAWFVVHGVMVVTVVGWHFGDFSKKIAAATAIVFALSAVCSGLGWDAPRQAIVDVTLHEACVDVNAAARVLHDRLEAAHIPFPLAPPNC